MTAQEPLLPLRLDATGQSLIILDQTRLPGEEHYLALTRPDEIREAIAALRVRGAPAIGLAAAYGYYLAACVSTAISFASLRAELAAVAASLAACRPTAVNLAWALRRMERRLQSSADLPLVDIRRHLLAEAEAIRLEDEAMGLAIGTFGLDLLQPGMNILTHCNAGILATSRYGTALSPIYLGQARGYHFHVYVDETRPLLQGARLTAWELGRAGVDHTLVTDSACALLMRQGRVDACLVGCDRIAANGDVANKIGTATLAIVARHFGVPFYVLGPASTVDLNCPDGGHIPIEERNKAELTDLRYRQRMAPPDTQVYNPAFDITDHELITAIVTDRGVIRPPYSGQLRRVFA
jgi:methylthioribose-1-phosphate isomerase